MKEHISSPENRTYFMMLHQELVPSSNLILKIVLLQQPYANNYSAPMEGRKWRQCNRNPISKKLNGLFQLQMQQNKWLGEGLSKVRVVWRMVRVEKEGRWCFDGPGVMSWTIQQPPPRPIQATCVCPALLCTCCARKVTDTRLMEAAAFALLHPGATGVSCTCAGWVQGLFWGGKARESGLLGLHQLNSRTRSKQPIEVTSAYPRVKS